MPLLIWLIGIVGPLVALYLGYPLVGALICIALVMYYCCRADRLMRPLRQKRRFWIAYMMASIMIFSAVAGALAVTSGVLRLQDDVGIASVIPHRR